jgi:hypothetical protein
MLNSYIGCGDNPVTSIVTPERSPNAVPVSPVLAVTIAPEVFPKIQYLSLASLTTTTSLVF